MRALHTAATGMMAQELNVQVISNNIANVRTTGYKKQRIAWQERGDHHPGLGKDDGKQQRIYPVAVLLHKKHQVLVQMQYQISKRAQPFHRGLSRPAAMPPTKSQRRYFSRSHYNSTDEYPRLACPATRHSRPA